MFPLSGCSERWTISKYLQETNRPTQYHQQIWRMSLEPAYQGYQNMIDRCRDPIKVIDQLLNVRFAIAPGG